MVSASPASTDATASETARMELMRETANTQHVSSSPVPTEPATTQVKSVMAKLIAGTPLMKPTALGCVYTTSFSVTTEIVSLAPLSVTMTLIAMTTVTNILAPTRPAVATSSLALMASAFIKIGFAMENKTVVIMEMKMDVITVIVIISVTLESGPAHSLDNASRLIKFVMGF